MTSKPLGVVICGITGRMGKSICAVAQSGGIRVLAGTNRQNPRLETVLATLEPSSSNKNVVIDFSNPEAAVENAQAASQFGMPILVGTTGLTAATLETLARLAGDIPVLVAPNTSLGANLLFAFTKMAADALPEAECAIFDIHHKDKKDAPSGTAAFLKAQAPKAQVLSFRGGDVKGDHSVHFFFENERLELTSRVADRSVFATGALKAAQFLLEQKPGLYKMADVLGLK